VADQREPARGSRPLPPEVRRAIRAAARPGRAVRGRRSQHRFTVALTVVLAVTLGVVGLGYGYVHFRFNQIASISLPGLQRSKPSRQFNLLVVGSDTRAGLKPGESQQFGTVAQAGGGQRSDVIIIVHVDPPAHKLSLLSIPRDLLVPIAGTGRRNKVNAAFDIGPERLIETIQQNFNIPINHYLLINFDGFRDIVNALGGAKLNFPYPVRDNDNGNNNSGLHITRTGCQLLNGDQALALARSRFYQYFKDGRWHYADSIPDLGRIRRQHIFLQVVLKTAIAKGLYNPVRANAFIGAVVHSLTKDSRLTVGDAVRLAKEFRSFNPDQLASYTLPTYPQNTPGFSDVLVLKQQQADQVIATFLGEGQNRTTAASPTTAPASVTVAVKNALGINQLAAHAAISLQRLGFHASAVGNASAVSQTIAYYPAGQLAAARAVDRAVDGPVHLVEDATLTGASVVLVLGPGYRAIHTSLPTATSRVSAGKPKTPAAAPSDVQLSDPRPC
jgi:LCP family protein required for cell wall assembly